MPALLAIYLRPAARLAVRSVTSAEAIAGVGLEGDHTTSGKRQVSLLSREAWNEACAELGQDVDPIVRRANLLVEGINLPETIGHSIQIGSIEIDIHGETRPCELLDDHGRIGLSNALRPNMRAGVYGTIRVGGQLRVGDTCASIKSD